MSILTTIGSTSWNKKFEKDIQTTASEQLEKGHILFLPDLQFILKQSEQKFLSPTYAHPKAKNISLDLNKKNLRCATCASEDYEGLKLLLNRFSDNANQLIQNLFPNYANYIARGRTSLRVVEISGRVSSYRKDDTRLHVDAFPATPNHGKRILRVFSNINPAGIDRVWRVGESFNDVAARFLPKVTSYKKSIAYLFKMLKITKTFRSEYDHIMLQIHDRMKEDMNYQKEVPQEEIRFPSNTTWIVQTDHVSHAAMSGQHLLEQTFYLPVHAMQNDSLSPLRTLENLVGHELIK